MNTIGTTGIIPFTYFLDSKKSAGSTYLRVESLITCAPDFEKWIHGKKYDNLIFQKAYWKDMMTLFRGPKILDLCDPNWLVEDIDIFEFGNNVHAITCSSEELTSLVKTYFPDKMVVRVPDRFDLSKFPAPRKLHEGQAKKLIWFGFIHNAYEMLEQLSSAIKKYNLELHIVSDEPYIKPDSILDLNPRYTKYDNATIYDLIKEADIVLNPKSNRVFYKYKSNNKTLIGWRLGLPVAVTNEDIEKFISADERNKAVEGKQFMIERDYNITASAEQYREIFAEIRKQKLFL